MLANSFRVLSIVILWMSVSDCLVGQTPRIGAAARLKAWQIHQEMESNSPFRELKWHALGPKFAGGRIESIDSPLGQPEIIYASVGAGGVWKTTNGGLTWKAIFQHESTFAIGDLAIAPGNADTLWIGTGECHLAGNSYAGNGVFKSTDAGKTWAHMGLTESAHIGKIVIDPDNEDIVYVASMGRMRGGGARGIYKTTDGGHSFERVKSAGEHVSFVDLVLDPSDSDRLYATAWDRSGGNRGGVFRSDDAGKKWKRLGGGLLEKNVGRAAVDASRSEPGVVYALMTDRSSPDLVKRKAAAILFRSNDFGDSWIRTNSEYVPTYIGWDFCDLRVAPDDADRVYIGGLRLIISKDGGKSFIGEGGFAINKNREHVFRIHPHSGIGLHLDVHEIWIDQDNPKRILLGNDGGLFASQDRGATWLHLNNLPIAEFYRVHLDDAKPFRIWGGTQDNASFVGPSTVRYRQGVDEPWRHVFLDPWSGGDGFSTFPDPHDTTTAYFTQQNGDLKRVTISLKQTGDDPPHKRPKRIKPRASDNETKLNFAWDTPFFASKHGTETVLYCAAQRVLRSIDSGENWESFSPDFGKHGLIVLSESPIDRNRLAAGGGRARVDVTFDGGKSWDRIDKDLPKIPIRDIVLSTHNRDRIYVVLSGKADNDSASYVFVSNDFGQTWESIATNLPHEPVNVLAEDPESDLLFVGTDLGVYASLNRGQHWESLGATLPTTATVDLAVHGPSGKIVAATHGLSLFLLDIVPLRGNLPDLPSDVSSSRNSTSSRFGQRD